MKNSNDTRDLPACSALPQPTAPPRTQNIRVSGFIRYSVKMWEAICFCSIADWCHRIAQKALAAKQNKYNFFSSSLANATSFFSFTCFWYPSFSNHFFYIFFPFWFFPLLNSWQTHWVRTGLSWVNRHCPIGSDASFPFAVHHPLYVPYILAIFRLPLPYTGWFFRY